MKCYNKIKGESYTISIQFDDIQKELVDIDEIFRQTNKHFAILLEDLGLVPTFDFDIKNNRTLYTHQFLHSICEYIKSRNNSHTLYFFNNSLTKDKFRNKLLKKIKTIFGFMIWDDSKSIDRFMECIDNNLCVDVNALEIFFNSEKNKKSLKHIKKYLQKEGLQFLNDTYFQEIANKMIICN